MANAKFVRDLCRAMRAHAPHGSNDAVSGGIVTIGDLGDYMDEVSLAVEALALDIADDQKTYPAKTEIGQSFLGSWVSFLNQDPYTLEPETLGWWSFYHQERGLVARLGEVSELWAATRRFETQLLKYYDEAVSLGLVPSRPRPTLGFDEPPTVDTVASTIKSAVTIAMVVAVLWGVGQVIKVRK